MRGERTDAPLGQVTRSIGVQDDSGALLLTAEVVDIRLVDENTDDSLGDGELDGWFQEPLEVEAVPASHGYRHADEALLRVGELKLPAKMLSSISLHQVRPGLPPEVRLRADLGLWQLSAQTEEKVIPLFPPFYGERGPAVDAGKLLATRLEVGFWEAD